MILSIEGIYGSGKTTLLKILKELGIPVRIIENIPDKVHWATLDNFSTIMKKMLEHSKDENFQDGVKEGSVWSTYYIMAAINYNRDRINADEFKIITDYFKLLYPKDEINAIIYLNVKPEVAYERLKKQNKSKYVSLDYLKGLQNFYQMIFEEFKDEYSIPIFKVDGNITPQVLVKTLLQLVAKSPFHEWNKYPGLKELPIELEGPLGMQSIERNVFKNGLWVLDKATQRSIEKAEDEIAKAIAKVETSTSAKDHKHSSK